METNYNQQRRKKKKKFSIIEDFFQGGIFNKEFVVKQSRLLIMIAVCFVFFIGNRYACLKKITQIEDLKKELRDLRYENLVLLTKLTEQSRQSQIEELVNAKGLDLSLNGPIYEIKK